MPGILAKKLCPDLILLKHSFGNYSKESKQVMKIISEFDPNFCCMSLDECYIDLTEYTTELFCEQNKHFDKNLLKQSPELPNFLWDFGAQIVHNIRQRILTETKLSASAGIGPNSMIAKVCSDVNKPNGQHMVRGNRAEVEDFLEKTAIRKICGIGPVRTQYLTALNINVCKDLWHKRDVIRFAFSPFNADYYLRVGLGVGSTIILKDEEPRKSISSERTVGLISGFEPICDLFRELSQELVTDLNEKNQSCKTVTIKLKKITFEVSLKSQTLSNYTSDCETILSVAKKLLETELSNTPIEAQKYRLIGLKVSNLRDGSQRNVSTSQTTLSQIFTALNKNEDKNQITCDMSEESDHCLESETQSHKNIYSPIYDSDLYECSVCFEKFNQKNIFENHENECIGQMLSNHLDDHLLEGFDELPEPIESNDLKETDNSEKTGETSSDISCLCPICSIHMTFKDNDQLNRHIDMCLNKDKCQELTQVPVSSIQTTPEPKVSKVVKRSSSDSKVRDKSNNSKKAKNKSSKSQKTIDFFFHSQ